MTRAEIKLFVATAAKDPGRAAEYMQMSQMERTIAVDECRKLITDPMVGPSQSDVFAALQARMRTMEATLHTAGPALVPLYRIDPGMLAREVYPCLWSEADEATRRDMLRAAKNYLQAVRRLVVGLVDGAPGYRGNDAGDRARKETDNG